MRKVLISLTGILFVCGAWAAEIAERKTCPEMQAQINEMSARNDLSDEETDALAQLRTQYRRDCSKRAAGRGARAIASARAKTIPVKVSDDAATAADTKTAGADDKSGAKDATTTSENGTENAAVPVKAECDTPDVNGCCPGEEFTDMGDAGKFCCESATDMCYPPMVVKTPEEIEQEKAAEIAANIAKGLCGDGTKPNKFGCCGDEKFTDMGNLVFGCCPADGGDCMPPIK